MNTPQNYDQLENGTVYDKNGDKIGGVSTLYTDSQTDEPTWVSVNTGFFGMRETLIPLQNVQVNGDEIRVPFDKDFVKNAPNIDADEHISSEEEQRLYEYYGVSYSGGQGTAGVTDTDRTRAGVGRDTDRDVDVDRRRDDEGEGVVRHEERLRVGTEAEEVGRVRLRKRVVTEKQSVDVPVRREEVRVERTPIADGKPVRDGQLSEDETEVVLHEEHARVEKETVPVERVDVQKRTVQDTEHVEADLAKEEVELDEDGTTTRHRGDNRR